MKETDRDPLKHALGNRRLRGAEDFINSQLADTISYYDYAENFYHGFMAGLLVNIGGYRVKSNRERKRQTGYRDDGIKTQRPSDDSGTENFRHDSGDGKEV